MRTLLFFSFSALIICCMGYAQKTTPDSLDKFTWVAKKDTSIIGKAFNSKAGAVVVDIYENTYYVEGLERWDEKYEGKLLKVKGRLAKMEYPGGKLPANPKEPQVQAMEGDMTVITKANWKLVKEVKKKKEGTRTKH